MRTVLKVIFGTSLLFAANAWAMDIQDSHSGSWYNPDQSGHGFSIEVLDTGKMVVYWLVYTPDGQPLFLTSLAHIEGDSAYGNLRQYSGMRFGEFNPATLSKEIWGSISITFTGCDSATVTYSSTASHLGVPYGSGQIDLVRLTSIDGLSCTLQLPEGKFGNFLTGEESFVWILRDGTLAYNVASDGVVLEIGYGHLVMTSESTFEYEVIATDDGSRSGTGMFEDGQVMLDLQELGVLSAPPDPAFHDEITYEDLAGEYSGPDAIFGATVDETGELNGNWFGTDFWGTLTIPEPGFNQLVQELRYDGGASQGVGIYDRVSGNLLFIYGENGVRATPWFRRD